MKVAIDISPLRSAHRFRGIGVYTDNLIKALDKRRDDNIKIRLVESDHFPANIDLVHYPYFNLFQPTLPLFKKRKTVVTIHDVTPLLFPKHFPPGIKGSLNLIRQKLALINVKAVICDSRASKKDIVKYLNYPEEKIFIIYLASGSEFKPIRSTAIRHRIAVKYNLPRNFVLYVGDVNYNKNILGLAKACKIIKIPLVIVGKKAAQKTFDRKHIENQPLVQLIEQFGKDPEVIRLGFVPTEDLVVIYNLAGVFCLPSFYEGFGVPVLEAMACGTPVVAAEKGSLPEISGRAAMLVNPCDVMELARGIKNALSKTVLRNKLSKAGIIQAKKFSWTKTAGETINVYKKVFDQRE